MRPHPNVVPEYCMSDINNRNSLAFTFSFDFLTILPTHQGNSGLYAVTYTHHKNHYIYITIKMETVMSYQKEQLNQQQQTAAISMTMDHFIFP